MRLFRKFTAEADAEALYASVVAEARRPFWYRDAGIPDTIDGRFAVLATVLALTDIRLERGTDEARAMGPRLAERFIADMDAQMREAGFGDPTLAKKVRAMVGALAGRVDHWRRAVEALEPWDKVATAILYGEDQPELDSVRNGIEESLRWWERLQRAGDSDLLHGVIA